MSQNVWATIMPFGPVTLIFYWPQKKISGQQRLTLISGTGVRNSVFSRVERSGTSGKTMNFSHEWKKSQIFNKDECKYLFLPFQLKNKACRFHSFIRMSMSCLLHKIVQRHVQCSKYTLI